MQAVIEKSDSGDANLLILKNGRSNPVYSKRSPRRDGIRFFQSRYERGCNFYLFIGLGLGYHIEPFVREKEVERIVILEPSWEIYTEAGRCECVKKILGNPKVAAYAGEELWSFIREIRARYELLFFDRIRVLSYQPLRRHFQSLYDRIESEIQKEISILTDDALTIAHFSRKWILNFFTNAQELDRVKLKSSLHRSGSGTAVITGAGPSLDHAMEEMGKKRDRFYLLATDASVRPLISRGIRPDLILSIDPQPVVCEHFRGLDRTLLESIPAVISVLAHPRAFNLFSNRYIFLTSHPTTNLFPPDVVRDNLVSGVCSVGTLALEVALSMGFDSVILAGFDFSFPGIRAYAGKTVFHWYLISRSTRTGPIQSLEADFVRKRSSRMERSMGAPPLYSSANLLGYRREMEEIVARRGDVRILQLGGGLVLRGAGVVASLRAATGYRRSREASSVVHLAMKRKLDQTACEMLECSLALRYRLLKHTGAQEASNLARQYLRYRYGVCGSNKKATYLKFQIFDSDI